MIETKYKKGFTLIELLVVVGIIVILSIFSIPAFSKYGKSATFKQKMDETLALINQAYVMSGNPEKGSDRYTIKVDGGNDDIVLYKGVRGDDSNDVEIKKVEFPSTYSLILLSGGRPYMNCETVSGGCCLVTDVNDKCDSSLSASDFFKVVDSSTKKDKTFNILEKPFMAKN